MAARLPAEIVRELEASGLEWSIVRRSRHYQLIVAGRPALVFPTGNSSWEGGGRRSKNALACVRRALRSQSPVGPHPAGRTGGSPRR